jgi:hypothetical protein
MNDPRPRTADAPFPDAPGVPAAGGLAPGETELVGLLTPDDLTLEDRRSDVHALPGVPAGPVVGLVDASVDATTQTAQIVIDAAVDLALDTFVVTPQRLVDGSVLFHYGLVTEITGRVEGAEMATDTPAATPPSPAAVPAESPGSARTPSSTCRRPRRPYGSRRASIAAGRCS